jgi:sensor c-di-GMP phosphodiesterase-like protein
MEFIPLAENTLTSGLISYWVIETVAAEFGDWLRANTNAQISINVPPEIIGRGGMLYAAEKSGLAELFPPNHFGNHRTGGSRLARNRND